MAVIKYLVFEDGREIPVAKDGGRYWVTMEGNYKKTNPAFKVKRVKTSDTAETKETAPAEEAETPAAKE